MKNTKKFKLMNLLIVFTALILSSCVGNSEGSDQNNASSNSPDKTSLVGELIRMDGDEMVIQQSDGNQVVLRLSENTVFWEGIDWMAEIPVEIGDQISAKGAWSKNQTQFAVESYYANLQELQGLVYYVSGETEAFAVDQPDQDYLILPLAKRTELLTETPEDPRSYKYYDLMPNWGEKLQVIGRKIQDPFVFAVIVTRMN
jgi:ABC-type Fe3+-hydroxamate transport system substrate-binding protein